MKENSYHLEGAKNTAGKIVVGAGASVGATAGAAVVSTAAANVAGAAAATATSSSLATTFAAFGVKATVTNPATWAVLASNPIGQAILIEGGAGIGAIAFWKVAKKLLQ